MCNTLLSFKTVPVESSSSIVERNIVAISYFMVVSNGVKTAIYIIVFNCFIEYLFLQNAELLSILSILISLSMSFTFRLHS